MDAESQPEGLGVNSPGSHDATPGKGNLPINPAPTGRRRQPIAGSAV